MGKGRGNGGDVNKCGEDVGVSVEDAGEVRKEVLGGEEKCWG